MNKNKLRERMKGILLGIDKNTRKKKDKIIFNKILNLFEFQKSKKIFTYVSYFKEVNTFKVIEYALKNDKEVFVPKICLKDKIIKIHKINSLNDLRPGVYDIPEPTTPEVKEDKFDIILIPGIAFDKKNARLGRGGGYFDKFLKNVKGLKIGVCYKEQIVEEIPMEKYDVYMDMVITD